MSEAFDRFRQEIEACAAVEGVTSLALMSLPENIRRALNLLIRKGPQTAEALAEALGVTSDEMRQLAEALEAKGFLLSNAPDNPPLYRPRLARTRELRPPPESPNR